MSRLFITAVLLLLILHCTLSCLGENAGSRRGTGDSIQGCGDSGGGYRGSKNANVESRNRYRDRKNGHEDSGKGSGESKKVKNNSKGEYGKSKEGYWDSGSKSRESINGYAGGYKEERWDHHNRKHQVGKGKSSSWKGKERHASGQDKGSHGNHGIKMGKSGNIPKGQSQDQSSGGNNAAGNEGAQVDTRW